jgi:DNA-binding CsgD family transcriptional regulator
MATTHPSSVSAISALPSRSRGVPAADRLRHLTTSLSTSWGSLDERGREALVLEIQRAVDELGSPAPLSPEGAETDPLRFLTPRERQVLDTLTDGATTQELAERLGVSTSTVRSYIKSLLSKLGVHSRLEAVALYMKMGGGAGRTRAGIGTERRFG